MVDDEDFEYLNQFKWNCSTHGYAVRGYQINNKYFKVYMAREVLQPKPGRIVDHINMDRLDNRRSNLREATNRQNSWNTKARRSNKLGVKGVHKDSNRYVAQIGWGRTHRRIGSYITLEEASRAYRKAARELYGEFAEL